MSAPQNPRARAFAPLRTSPISLFQRENLTDWLELAARNPEIELSRDTQTVLAALTQMGALFFVELVRTTRLLPVQVEQALAELAALGFVTSDGFDGLRALLVPSDKRPTLGRNDGVRRRKTNLASVEFAGRWSLLRTDQSAAAQKEPGQSLSNLHLSPKPRLDGVSSHHDDVRNSALEKFARVLLHRYGVVFRRLLERESLTASWYDLGRVYRRWEARGEIRGGHFVSGVSGEQFALPEAIGLLRSIRKAPMPGELITLSAADPLNLQGILTPGSRVPALASNRILFCDGLPIAALEAGEIRRLNGDANVSDERIEQHLRVRKLEVPMRPYYG